MDVRYRPIGVIHSRFKNIEDMPIQPTCELSSDGVVEIFPEYAEGLKDLEGFSHIILLSHLHQVRGSSLTVVPFLDSEPHGVFATRAPKRPNPIGLSVVRLLTIEKNILKVANIDLLDGTPLLDVKPYVPEFDEPPSVRVGWLEAAKGKVRSATSDDRFR